ncbi:phage-related protein [Methanobacterium formicicum]|uniref:Phage-related protein n=1 Tax=Methanobacterium formicicum TaxID=2162 RepID=A0A089ZH14_METFO|nr:SHOCT domain-containing protein [Methanobacterium formicicum]AIS32495.1 phage-related protein [Methanobacterium formicicum]
MGMFETYRCPNEKCPWNSTGSKDDQCPECGSELQSFGIRDGATLMGKKNEVKKIQTPENQPKIKEELKEETQDEEIEKGIFKGYNAKKNNKKCIITFNDTSLNVKTERMHLLGGQGEENNIPYSNILIVNTKRHGLSKIVEIKTAAETFKFTVFKTSPFIGMLNERIQESKNPQTSIQPQENSSAEKLKEAKELLDIGAINQEEFDEIKQKHLKNL